MREIGANSIGKNVCLVMVGEIELNTPQTRQYLRHCLFRGTAMMVESVRWTATALVAGCLMCSGIMADISGECYERESYNASRSIPCKETYYERCWLFFTCVKTRTNYINETYEAFRLNRTCCGGYENKSGNCVAQYSRGCQNCQKPRTCGCSENPKKCVSVCETEYRISIFWSQCDDEHKFSADRTKCSPKCNPSCAENAWCQKPNTCVCMPRYVGNGTSCLPECKKGCANGRCVAPDECLCNDGWNGPSCDEPLACVVASLVPESHSDDTPASNLLLTMGTDDETNYSEIARTVPACGINCPDELLMHAFHSTKSGANVTYHLIPYNGGIDVRCNNTKPELSFLEKHSNLIAGVLLAGATLFLIGITRLGYISRLREKSKNTTNDDPEPTYDDVGFMPNVYSIKAKEPLTCTRVPEGSYKTTNGVPLISEANEQNIFAMIFIVLDIRLVRFLAKTVKRQIPQNWEEPIGKFVRNCRLKKELQEKHCTVEIAAFIKKSSSKTVFIKLHRSSSSLKFTLNRFSSSVDLLFIKIIDF
ncbi:uncharacterized protein LOC124407934 [Diprion similis]|uniref:uncharacterized protein LOC124407934 n=1 Tax=Diprion similis TaxID=362088 RepID=UPI001EF92C66|nr:uncharacterized protein LOC124407934 [Diprion similis]